MLPLYPEGSYTRWNMQLLYALCVICPMTIEAIPLLLKSMIIIHINTARKNKESSQSVKSRTCFFILSHLITHPFFGNSTGFLQWHDDAYITTKVICLSWEGFWDNILYKRLKNLWVRGCVICVRCVGVVFVFVRRGMESRWYGMPMR